jgi:hypothetical protein
MWHEMRDGPNASWAVYYEEREYPAGTSRGRYQLWVDDEYVRDITAEVLARQEKTPPSTGTHSNSQAVNLAKLSMLIT